MRGLLPAGHRVSVDIDGSQVVIAGHRAASRKKLASEAVDVVDHEGVAELGAEGCGEAFAVDEGALVH